MAVTISLQGKIATNQRDFVLSKRQTGEEHDPCVLDVFLSVVDFMESGEPAPWWKFTAERKKHMIKD